MRRDVMVGVFFGALLVGMLVGSYAAIPRSDAARHAFAKATPCPSTGKAALPCPGYIIDHIVPLCGGGDDDPGNMQWQTVANAKLKDAFEMRACRCFKQSAAH